MKKITKKQKKIWINFDYINHWRDHDHTWALGIYFNGWAYNHVIHIDFNLALVFWWFTIRLCIAGRDSIE